MITHITLTFVRGGGEVVFKNTYMMVCLSMDDVCVPITARRTRYIGVLVYHHLQIVLVFGLNPGAVNSTDTAPPDGWWISGSQI